MGFYAPATIVGDAQRHGLEVRPIDVTRSAWDCTLEDTDDDFGFAVRMGLRWTKGLQLGDGQRIALARRARAFDSIADFVRRTGISSRAHTQLAEAGALGTLVPDGESRRDALWQVTGWIARQHDTLAVGDAEGQVAFEPLGKLDEIFWDYTASDHSTRGHPLAPLRQELRANRWPDARTIARGRDGQRTEYVGIVICRQQPGTASGVVFMTLEDETGFVNLVVCRDLRDAARVPLLARERLGEERVDVAERVVDRVQARPDRDDVGVVVLAREARGLDAPHQRGTDAGDLVRGDLLAVARTAEHDPARRRPGRLVSRDGARGLDDEGRVVVERIERGGAVVEHLVAGGGQVIAQGAAEREARVVGPDVDAHAGARDCTTGTSVRRRLRGRPRASAHVARRSTQRAATATSSSGCFAWFDRHAGGKQPPS